MSGCAILKIADPEDIYYPLEPTDILIDLNEAGAGSASGWFIRDGAIDFDAGSTETEFLGSFASDGDLQSGYRERTASLSFRLSYQGTDAVTAGQNVRDLADALDDFGVLIWQPEGETEPYFIDFQPSPIPELYAGQTGGLYKVGQLAMHPDGIAVTIFIHPFLRKAPVEIEAQNIEIDMPSGVPGRDILLTNPGNRPGEVILELTPADAVDRIVQYRYGIRAHGDLAEFRTWYQQDLTGSGSSYGVDTSAVALGGDETGGTVARSTFTSDPSLQMRVRRTVTPTILSCIDGQFLAVLRFTYSGGATTGKHKLQIRHGFSSDAQVLRTSQPVLIDADDISVSESNDVFVEVELGLIIVDYGAPEFTFEIWASREDGDQSLDLDQVTFEPADHHHATVGAAGFRVGRWGRRHFQADDLFTSAGAVLRRGEVRLNAVNEYTESRPDQTVACPDAGFPLTAGVYVAHFDGSVREATKTGNKIGHFRVRKTTTATCPTFTTVASANIRSARHSKERSRDLELHFEVTAADVTAGARYVLNVEFTAAAGDSRRVAVDDLELRFLRTSTEDLPLQIDSFERRCQLLSSGDQVGPWMHENNLPLAPAGDSVWVISWGKVPLAPGLRKLDEREPVPDTSPRTNDVTVSGVIIPRFTH